ncbi:transcriptional regulator, TetR family [Sphingobium faniae]|nr:transcriptional regulator, TetR family [Sphingobium faniae]
MMDSSSSPSLSRREVRRRDRRDAILCVAARSFLENGYAGTTMSGIAAALGGSKGTLWSHFPSKEELFASVLDQKTSAYRAQLSQILDPCGDLVTTLHRACVSLLEKMTSSEAIALHRLTMSEAGRISEIGRIFYRRGPHQTRMLIAEFLSGAMERGQLRKADPEAAARVITALITSGCHQKLLVGEIVAVTPDMIAADADFTVGVFMRAHAPEMAPAH